MDDHDLVCVDMQIKLHESGIKLNEVKEHEKFD